MQLNSVNNVNPNFGMAVKVTPEAMDNLSKSFKNVSDWVEFDKFITREENNDVADVLLSAVGKKISAQVGPNRYEEGFFGGPMKAIRRAVAKAEDLRTRHDAVKLEADADYAQNVRNRVEVLPSQKPIDTFVKGEEEGGVKVVGGGDNLDLGSGFRIDVDV